MSSPLLLFKLLFG